MSGIPPANLASGIAATTLTQKQRADEKNTEEHQKADQARERANLSDKQKYQVEDTLEAETRGVRRHDDEESHQKRRHKHRKMPEDQQETEEDQTDEEQPHIDLQA